MTAKVLVCIPCFNRRSIAEQCIPTVRDGMAGCDSLHCYDDASNEFSPDFLYKLGANSASRCSENIGVERWRRLNFMEFYMNRDGGEWTHLYLTDSDALHDPGWRSEALRLQDIAGGAPVCLYNTQAHVRLIGNTIEDDKSSPIIWRRVAPGISYLLTADHVRRVVEAIKHMPDPLHWDWTVPAILGHRMAISRTSYCDHIGHGGLHDSGEGYDGGDRATAPTPWLVQKRAEVVGRLSG